MKFRLDFEIKPFSWEVALYFKVFSFDKTVTINKGSIDRTIKENIFRWESGDSKIAKYGYEKHISGVDLLSKELHNCGGT